MRYKSACANELQKDKVTPLTGLTRNKLHANFTVLKSKRWGENEDVNLWRNVFLALTYDKIWLIIDARVTRNKSYDRFIIGS